MGSPDAELPDTTLFLAVFFKMSKPIFRLYWNKSKTRSPESRPYGNFVTVGEAGFSALWGERVNKLN